VPTETAELTIDQLARRTGMSARNIRAHQSRGLLAPPMLRGRTGYYNGDHAARVELIQELQSDGFSLELIRKLVAMAGGSSAGVLRFARALRPFGDERPQVVEQAWRGAEVFAELGVPVEEIVEVAAESRGHIDAVAAEFLRLFIDRVWRPFEEAGHPDEGLERVLEALERLRPLASATVQSLFQMSMGEAAERVLGSELQRLERERPDRAEQSNGNAAG
jgi:DNA-binding transcriptional MerR regulator